MGVVGTAGASGTAAGANGSTKKDTHSGGIYVAGGKITIN
jgi:hypothetical protein